MLINLLKKKNQLEEQEERGHNMTKYENECCGCATESYPCLGSACPNRHVPHFYCDKCGEDVEELYKVDGEELCEECLKDNFEKVELEEY